MGRALELISGSVVDSLNVVVAVTMASGDALTVRNAPLDADVRLLQLWADIQAATGMIRVRSPRLHDNVQGLRFQVPVSDCSPLLPWGVSQKLYPQDTLISELQVNDAAGDLETIPLLIHYSNLPGADARLATWEDVMRRMTGHIVTVENTITAATGPNWTGAEALNAELDLLKANTDYALLGYRVAVECAAVAWRGPDTGNLRLGGPGIETQPELTSDWFKRLSLVFGIPLIPIFNSANKSGTLIDVVQDENAAAVPVISILAEIGPTTVK